MVDESLKMDTCNKLEVSVVKGFCNQRNGVQLRASINKVVGILLASLIERNIWYKLGVSIRVDGSCSDLTRN